MKHGFTLIELIFTIVILAITTMAIPRMVAQTAELNVFAIKQELVMNAKTVMTQISKVPWDSAWKYAGCTTNPAATDDERRANAAVCNLPTRIHNVPNGDRFINQRAGIVRIA
ncbi:MAG: type II secretion system protein, partial [Campylobacter sp.]|nr:type II secretion system protein [Campylobacter sp.]